MYSYIIHTSLYAHVRMSMVTHVHAHYTYTYSSTCDHEYSHMHAFTSYILTHAKFIIIYYRFEDFFYFTIVNTTDLLVTSVYLYSISS